MSLSNTTYSTDPDAFDIDGVAAGDAAAMESKLQALIDASVTPSGIGDMTLSGVEEGPEWVATLVFSDGGLASRDTARVFAAVAGNKTEAYLKLRARLLAGNAQSVIGNVNKIAVSGGGDGSAFMALALVGPPVG